MSTILQPGAGYAEVNGARLYYEAAGAGRPLLLVHAGIADSRMWDDQWEPFARRYTTIRCDLRGMGRSAMPPGPFAYHEDLHGLLAHLGVEHATLLGVSMGGMAALDCALAYPSLVDALILVGAGIGGSQPPEELFAAWEQVDALVEAGDLAGANELELRLWVDGPRRAPGEVDTAVRERVRVMNGNNLALSSEAGEPRRLEPPALGRLGEVKAPTLVIAGAEDQPHVLAAAEALAAGIPSARTVVMAGTAHVPSMERPQEFNRTVLDFLSEIHS